MFEKLNTFLNNKWVKEEIKREIKNNLEKMETTYQNVWNTAKAVLRGKFIAESLH
jgi:hypothetical protein